MRAHTMSAQDRHPEHAMRRALRAGDLRPLARFDGQDLLDAARTLSREQRVLLDDLAWKLHNGSGRDQHLACRVGACVDPMWIAVRDLNNDAQNLWASSLHGLPVWRVGNNAAAAIEPWRVPEHASKMRALMSLRALQLEGDVWAGRNQAGRGPLYGHDLLALGALSATDIVTVSRWLKRWVKSPSYSADQRALGVFLRLPRWASWADGIDDVWSCDEHFAIYGTDPTNAVARGLMRRSDLSKLVRINPATCED